MHAAVRVGHGPILVGEPVSSSAGRAVNAVRSLRAQVIIAAALTLASLVPFLGKAVHIDDPLFLWAARQIQTDPLHPYAFDVNWYGNPMPMAETTKNPPLASYYIAAVAGLFGERELVLHTAFLVPAIAVVVATLLFARRSCEAPLVAALFIVASPLFLISSSTLMCDTLMLAFWMAGLLVGIAGLERERLAPLALSAGFGTAAVFTKYFGLCLMPLLILHAWTRKRRLGAWVLPLLLPVGAVLAYEVATRSGAGVGQLFSTFDYVAQYRTNSSGGPLWARALSTLAFVGGGMIPALACAPVLWSRRVVLGGLAVASGIAIVLPVIGVLGSFELPAPALERALFCRSVRALRHRRPGSRRARARSVARTAGERREAPVRLGPRHVGVRGRTQLDR